MTNKQPPATQRGNGLTDAKRVMSASERGGFNAKETAVSAPIVVGGRQPYTFVGTRETSLTLDPKEFAGQSPVKITEDIYKLLREIDPNVSWYDADVELAAQDIDDINHGKNKIPGSDPDFQ